MKNILTKKIRLSFCEPDDKKRKEQAYKFWDLVNTGYAIANIAATHFFMMEKSKDFMYWEDEVKTRLENYTKGNNGLLNTSHENAVYRVISKRYKGDYPAVIFSAIVRGVRKNFQAERKEYFTGERSLRSYKKNMPVPIPERYIEISDQTDEYDNLFLEIMGMKFRTILGRDRQNVKGAFDKIHSGEWKIKQSTISAKKKHEGDFIKKDEEEKKKENKNQQIESKSNYKYYLNLTLECPAIKTQVKEDKECIARLSADIPIIANIGKKSLWIGDRESYLHKRIALQAAGRRRQQAAKHNFGGKGREKKLKGIWDKDVREANMAKTMMHKFSHDLIKLCIDHQCGTLVLEGVEEGKKKSKIEAAENKPFLLRNWGYHGLTTMIKYKAQYYNINVVERSII